MNTGINEKERNKNAIVLLTVLVVKELAEKSKQDTSDVLADFLDSRTAKILFNEETKLWWDGPSSIVQMYKEELLEKDKTC